MVPNKHVDGVDTRFPTMAVLLVKNPLGRWLRLIIKGTYQAASEDSRWAYKPVSGLRPDIDHDSDSINDGLIDEISKDQEKLYDK